MSGRASVDVEAPDAWRAADSADPANGRPDILPDLELVGPQVGTGRPRMRVYVHRTATSIDEESLTLLSRVRTRFPDALIVACDIWPHPVWGEGRLVQSARLVGDIALAHDCYLFVGRDCVVCIEVDCPLSDLLSLEDQIADIVAHTRPKVA